MCSRRTWRLPDDKLAGQLGRTMFAIQTRRIAFGIAKFNAQWRSWSEKEISLLGKLPDEEIAWRLGRTLDSVKVRRGKLKLSKPYSRHRRWRVV